MFTASPSADTKAGALAQPTADGWDIAFDRILVSLGRASLDGSDCSVYSDARYARLLSLIGAPDAQKISESYGIGRCDFGFAIGNASADSLLGVGATEADLALMRTAASDRYNGLSGVSMFVSGRAQKGERTLTFAWPFRGRVRYRECRSDLEATSEDGLSLKQGGDVTLDVALHAEALFTEDPSDPEAALRFEPVANADGNADGDVTLDELSDVPLSDLRTSGRYAQSEDAPGAAGWTTLEDFIYLGAAPQIARFQETGACQLNLANLRDEED
jgi:hypothetical protein